MTQGFEHVLESIEAIERSLKTFELWIPERKTPNDTYQSKLKNAQQRGISVLFAHWNKAGRKRWYYHIPQHKKLLTHSAATYLIEKDTVLERNLNRLTRYTAPMYNRCHFGSLLMLGLGQHTLLLDAINNPEVRKQLATSRAFDRLLAAITHHFKYKTHAQHVDFFDPDQFPYLEEQPQTPEKNKAFYYYAQTLNILCDGQARLSERVAAALFKHAIDFTPVQIGFAANILPNRAASYLKKIQQTYRSIPETLPQLEHNAKLSYINHVVGRECPPIARQMLYNPFYVNVEKLKNQLLRLFNTPELRKNVAATRGLTLLLKGLNTKKSTAHFPYLLKAVNSNSDHAKALMKRIADIIFRHGDEFSVAQLKIATEYAPEGATRYFNQQRESLSRLTKLRNALGLPISFEQAQLDMIIQQVMPSLYIEHVPLSQKAINALKDAIAAVKRITQQAIQKFEKAREKARQKAIEKTRLRMATTMPSVIDESVDDVNEDHAHFEQSMRVVMTTLGGSVREALPPPQKIQTAQTKAQQRGPEREFFAKESSSKKETTKSPKRSKRMAK